MSKNNELIRLGELRDWQAELPFLDWKDNGSLPFDVDRHGKIAYPIKRDAHASDDILRQMSGNLLPSSAPVLMDYQAFQQAKLNAMVAEVRR